MSFALSQVNARGVFWLASIAILLSMLYLSRDYGVTFDELDQDLYGQKVLAYFTSGFADHSSETFKNLSLYGGLFDFLAASLERLNIFALPMMARHALNAFFGWLAIHFAALCAGRIAGLKAAFAGLAVMLCCPVFFGHCMNNPKDIPLAAFVAMTLFLLLDVKPSYPYFSGRTLLLLSASIALAINVRVVGMMLFGDLGLILAAAVIFERNFSPARLAKLTARVVAVVLFGLVAGTLFWPWAQANPLLRPFLALRTFSHFAAWNQDVLFGGHSIPAAALPRSYVVTHFLIQTPPLLLIGALGAIYLALRNGYSGRRCLWVCLCCLLLPLAFAVIAHPTLYDGIRHFLFLYPIIGTICAVALTHFCDSLALASRWRYAAYFAVAVGAIEPAAFSIRNHPFQSSYFSPLIGGARGAFANYEMDFWGTCIYQGMSWVESQRLGTQSKAVKILWRNYWPFYRPAFPNLREATALSDYQIVPMRDSAAKLRALLIRPGLLHQVTIDGVPLCLVFDGQHPATGRVF